MKPFPSTSASGAPTLATLGVERDPFDLEQDVSYDPFESGPYRGGGGAGLPSGYVGRIRKPEKPPRNPPEALAHNGVRCGVDRANDLDDIAMPKDAHSPRAEDTSTGKL